MSALVVLAALSFAPGASATKYFDSSFGTTGAQGGQFNTPRDMVVNDPTIADGTGRDGWIYVVDASNSRIQAFDQNNVFQFAIGRDVVSPGGTGNTSEQQRVTVDATAGQFTLAFGAATTSDLAFDVPAATVAAALNGLSTIGGAGGSVTVTGGPGGAGGTTPYLIRFGGSLAGIDVAQVVAANGTTPLTGTSTVTTTVAGNSTLFMEKCTVAAQCKAGSAGTATDGPGGEFATAQGIDINQSTGRFYVRENGNNRRVQEFTADGDFVRAWGWNVVQEGTSGDTPTDQFETCFVAAECQAAATAGTALGQFGASTTASTGIAVAPAGTPAAGDVFAADPGSSNRRILRFAVPSNVASSVVPVTALGGPDRYGPLATTSCEHPRHIAIDLTGIVYGTAAPTCSAEHSIQRYDLVQAQFLSGVIPSAVTGGVAINVLEVNPENDHLLVSAASGLREFDLTSKPADVTSSHLVDTHGPGLIRSGSIVPNGIATNRASGKFIISTSSTLAGTGTGSRLVILDDSGVDPAPSVNPLPAEGIEATSATLRAEINPNGPTGFATAYRFQVSKDGVTWTDITSNASVGDGGAMVVVDDVAGGLEANTLYRFRVRTERNSGAGVTFSSELTLLTDPAPPSVETNGTQHITDLSAQLVGRLNPGGLQTDYWFEWGDDDYGNSAPVPAATASGSVVRTVVEPIVGLDPESTYHFRLCAQNSQALIKVCGADTAFTTRSVGSSPDGRGYEMVTSPDKALRRGSDRGLALGDLGRFQGSTVAPDGDSAMWKVFGGVVDPNAGAGFAFSDPYELRSRVAAGWTGEATVKISPSVPVAEGDGGVGAFSEDLQTQIFQWSFPMFSSGAKWAAHVMGDTGGVGGGGWYPLVDSAWLLSDSVGTYLGGAVVVADEGERFVASATDGEQYRDVVPSDGGGAAASWSTPQTGGRALLRYDSPTWRPSDVLNECTGSVGGGDATEVLTRDDGGTPVGPPQAISASATSTTGSPTISVNVAPASPFGVGQVLTAIPTTLGANFPPGTTIVATGSGTLTVSAAATASGTAALIADPNTAAAGDDTIAARPCEVGSPTDVSGASAFFNDSGRLNGSSVGVMSDDGSRSFFISPDPVASAPTTCATTGGAATSCPQQIFVRSYDGDGDATVRWISRAEDSLFSSPRQEIGLMGNGAAFEAASPDGNVVYFRTNAPLTEDDPNGGAQLPNGYRTGTASPRSWDLYRYELPDDRDVDPDDGTLTRVSGGPGSDADPNTNCGVAAADCGGAANGAGGALRFMSDDGERAYFVTTSRIGAADDTLNETPTGSSATNVPGGATSNNTSTRNLYLYDASKPQAAAYKFIASIPYGPPTSGQSTSLASCASSNSFVTGAVHTLVASAGTRGVEIAGNCVGGTSSGDAIVFETPARLTPDDIDDASDVYLYDAIADELVRLSAPPSSMDAPYPCVLTAGGDTVASCNGDLGFVGGHNSGPATGAGIGVGARRNHNLAEDSAGRLTAVFFESRLPLTDDDSNSDRMDVFGWSRAGGRLSLLTPGDSDDSAFYTGNSRDGTSVFFWTEKPIDAHREIDPADGDIYVARVGGGFPPPPAPPTVCEVLGGGCHGSGDTPISTVIESGGSDDGDAVGGERRALSLTRPSRRMLARAARAGVLPVRVRVDRASVVRVSATARLGGRVRVVGRVSVRLHGAGDATGRLRLSASARRRLNAGRPLALRVTATAAGAHARGMQMTLRRAGR